jgi:ribosome biogenesis protein ERB1
MYIHTHTHAYIQYIYRSVSIHKRLPLFATGGEDGMVYVFHGMVYNDLMDNPLVVPLKRIHAHTCDDTDGVMDCSFHPTQPWLLTCGVDKDHPPLR